MASRAVAASLALLAFGEIGAERAERAEAPPAPWVVRLQGALAAVESRNTARIGVWVRDLESGQTAVHRADRRWYLASMVKVPVAMAVLRGVERGDYTLDTTLTVRAADYVDGAGATNHFPAGTPLSIRFLLAQMLVLSDNTASDMLIDLVGLAEVNALVASLVPEGFRPFTSLAEIRRLIYGHVVPNVERLRGRDLLLLRAEHSDAERIALLSRLVDAPPGRRPPSLDAAYDAYYATGLNSARLDAYGELLVLLVDGKALSPRSTEHLLSIMERSATGTNRIKAGLPPSVRFAHKTGTQRRRVCDAGLARWPEAGRERRALVVACTEGEASLDRAESALMQVGLAVCASGLFNKGNADVASCPSGAGTLRLPAAPRR